MLLCERGAVGGALPSPRPGRRSAPVENSRSVGRCAGVDGWLVISPSSSGCLAAAADFGWCAGGGVSSRMLNLFSSGEFVSLLARNDGFSSCA